MLPMPGTDLIPWNSWTPTGGSEQLRERRRNMGIIRFPKTDKPCYPRLPAAGFISGGEMVLH